MLRILIFLISFSAFSQRTITGTVSDTLNAPLESANVIAKPLQENATIKFSIADHQGRYKLVLEKNVKYELIVSYIGFSDATFILEANSDITEHNFLLKNTGEVLKEVVITHEYKPIIVKKDTLIFDVKAFASGNERKMKEILEKLPGVEVDKNGTVTVQGKKVTKMLVEGSPFFGGGSKLAVENIPADALDKIEVIDHFNEVGFMKKVSDSEDLAMNVKLKEDKKKFVFGDMQAGIEAGNDDNGFYLGHTALFYYSPKTNLAFIGDMNNIGKSTFTFEDLMRFGGGISSYLPGRKSLSNLYLFTQDNTDVIENKSQFGALNFKYQISEKVDISGFGLFSKIFTLGQSDTHNQYLQNSSIAFENKFQKDNNQSLLGMGNMKLDYSPNSNEKLYYNAQFQGTNNDFSSTINSISDQGQNTFQTIKKADNLSLKQYIEWHKSINRNHTITFVVNHAFDKNTPKSQWLTDSEFLAGFIPLQSDEIYNISQIKKVGSNSVDALLKHYWIINNFNHIYSVIGNNFGSTNLTTSEKQLLSDGTINDFAIAGFGNKTDYTLNDTYVGLEYKFRTGKLTSKPGIYLHNYHLNTNQTEGKNTLQKILFEPQWDSEFELNKSEALKFKYKLANDFPTPGRLANRFTLESYNSVFKGNALLKNERFHSANLFYEKTNLYRGIMIYANANFNKKIRTIRNQIILEGINQYTTPLITDNPETNWRFNSSITKSIYRFKLVANANLNWFDYIQDINGITTKNSRNNQNIGLEIKTAHKKWSLLSFEYIKGFNEFNGLTTSRFQTDEFRARLEYEITSSLVLKADYDNFRNSNDRNQNKRYEIANASLYYQEKNSPWGFEFSAANFLNNKIKENNSFSDYIISKRTTYTLPRIFLFTVNYKL